MKKTLKKIGLSPGTLMIPEGTRPKKSELNLVQYNSDSLETYLNRSLDEILKLIKPDKINWIQVQGISDIKLFEQLGKAFNIHPLFLEDILHAAQRPKFETYDESIYIICRLIRFYEKKIELDEEQIAIVVSKNIFITCVETDNAIFEPIIHRLRKQHSRLRENNSTFLAYSIIDLTVDYCAATLDQIDVFLEKFESELVRNPRQNVIARVQQTKRLMANLRNAIWPMREVISQFQRVEHSLISENTKFYLHDVSDHLSLIFDTIITFREISETLLELHLSYLSQRMNDVMRTLTIVATIFVPLTFITSLYGMNFRNMPELEWYWGYPFILGLLLIMASGMLLFFRRKRWI